MTAKEAHDLAQALQKNTVIKFFSFSLFIHCCISMQTLTTLDLKYNQIGTQGAEYFAQALQNNSVRKFSFLPTM